MLIRNAGTRDQNQIWDLLDQARYVYRSFGWEDLEKLLKTSTTVVGIGNWTGQEQRAKDNRFWSFLAVEIDESQQAQIRGVAVRQGISPTTAVAKLLNVIFPNRLVMNQNAALPVPSYTASSTFLPSSAVTVTCYASEPWLAHALRSYGFEVEERIEFLRLNKLTRRTVVNQMNFPQSTLDSELSLRPAQLDDLEALVELDAETFAPRWHFDQPAMLELLMSTRVRIVESEGRIVGYSALSIPNSLSKGSETFLARLGVSPKIQRHGIGRHLLNEVILYAQQEGAYSILLNTQTMNQQSQHLYRSAGFRPTGKVIPLLAKTMHYLVEVG